MFKYRSTAALKRAAWVSGAVLSGVVPAVLAADDKAAGLEEVVVTARRVNESLQDTPVAITAITTEAISNFRLQDMSEFASLAPNAYVPKDAYNQNTRISIRGGRNVDPQVEPDFGLYRNGQYYGGPRTNLNSLVDVERVEVLRGPQVALYGRNSMNGAVNIVFATPTAEEAAYISAEYGNSSAPTCRPGRTAAATRCRPRRRLVDQPGGWPALQPGLNQEMDSTAKVASA